MDLKHSASRGHPTTRETGFGNPDVSRIRGGECRDRSASQGFVLQARLWRPDTKVANLHRMLLQYTRTMHVQNCIYAMLGTYVNDTIEVFKTGFLENARVLVVLVCVSRWSTDMIEWNALWKAYILQSGDS